jgi:hypothetical protein
MLRSEGRPSKCCVWTDSCFVHISCPAVCSGRKQHLECPKVDVSDTLGSMDGLAEIVVRTGQRSFACLALAAFGDSATFQRSRLVLGLMCGESMLGSLDADFGPTQTLALVPWLAALAQPETRLERSSNRRIGSVVVNSLADIWTLIGTDVYCCSTCFH